MDPDTARLPRVRLIAVAREMADLQEMVRRIGIPLRKG
jgi:hypothetical protein